MTVPNVTLNDRTSIPQLGFGVFQVPPAQTQQTVETAFEVGYRHIDTAQMYENEAGVGAAIAAAGLARDELYITSKLNNGLHEPDAARRSFDESLERLGLDRIDLFLIHWPLPTRYDGDFVSTWRTLAEFVTEGRAASVGVSNFQPAHLDRIVDETGVLPAVNQIEVHPYFGNEDARAASHRHGVVVEAWSPIAQGQVLDDPTIAEIAAAHGKTTSQVTARRAGRHRLPEVDARGADARELRHLRLHAGPRPGRCDQRARQGRGRAPRSQPGHVRLDPVAGRGFEALRHRVRRRGPGPTSREARRAGRVRSRRAARPAGARWPCAPRRRRR